MLNGNPNDLKEWKAAVLKAVRRDLARRDFLKAAMAGFAAMASAPMLPRLYAAAGDGHAKGERYRASTKAVKTGEFFFPRLMFQVKDSTPDRWNVAPVGDAILRQRLVQLTNINASKTPVVVKLADLESMSRYPFVFATSEGYFDLPKNEEANLKEFLLRGGFVYADDCVYGQTGDRFFLDYRKLINKLFPDNVMQKIPNDHEINHCYFDFPKGAPFLQGVDHGAWGLIEKDTKRIMTYLTPGDLHCGWCCKYFSSDKDEAALRMGINIIIYYLTH